MPGASDTNTRQLRCHCGNLLARLVPGGVEIKCRRCKRQVVIPLEPKPSDTQQRGIVRLRNDRMKYRTNF